VPASVLEPIVCSYMLVSLYAEWIADRIDQCELHSVVYHMQPRLRQGFMDMCTTS
jgi:hypothetical protein